MYGTIMDAIMRKHGRFKYHELMSKIMSKIKLIIDFKASPVRMMNKNQYDDDPASFINHQQQSSEKGINQNNLSKLQSYVQSIDWRSKEAIKKHVSHFGYHGKVYTVPQAIQ